MLVSNVIFKTVQGWIMGKVCRACVICFFTFLKKIKDLMWNNNANAIINNGTSEK